MSTCFLLFFEIFFQPQNRFTSWLYSHSAKISKYRNDQNLAAEHLAPGITKSTAVAWVWISVGP
jgi:hypothetical protein